ncbi:hypothetical protein [Rhodococcus sp. IEGM 1379]|uniref:hypothetical protein n=1 Tax=Rhodococcus sp. IEGM 1379 TaxID=3047086 RepID=UPI0024B75BD5|nr:hypothetical protein [Rhodococcus sp. IEGM 1379]MDI9914371.1 hypothetical protein [Rhodococcus sp. IEGM 1379]
MSEMDRNKVAFCAGTVYAIGTALMVEMNPGAPTWQMLLAVPAFAALAACVLFMLAVLG